MNELNSRIRNLRIVLFGIILATIPFYFLGTFLYIVAPRQGANALPSETPTLDVTFTPLGLDVTATRTLIPSPTGSYTATPLNRLVATPYQFLPPARTNTPIPTLYIPLTATTAPSLTPLPSNTALPTATFLPTLSAATSTPVPTNTPVPPTSTPIPAPTDTPIPVPTETPIPAPTDTPVPIPTDTPIPLPTDTPVPPEPTATTGV